MEDQAQVLLAGDARVGQPCTRCQGLLQAGDEVVVCPRCKRIHHAACWVEHGGCARRGCPQVASRLPAKAPTATESSVATRSVRSRRWVTAALISAALMAAVIAVVGWIRHAGQEPKHVVVMLPAAEDQAVMTQLIREYNRSATTQADLLLVPGGGALYQEKLVIMLVAKQPPDLIVLPRNRLEVYARQGALLPLDDLVSAARSGQGGNWLQRLPTRRLSHGKVDGHYYGLPHPGLPQFFAIPKTARKAEQAKQVLRFLMQRIPVQSGVDDAQPGPLWEVPFPLRFSPVPGA